MSGFWFNKKIELDEEAWKKIQEADEAPIDYEAIEEFKNSIAHFYEENPDIKSVSLDDLIKENKQLKEKLLYTETMLSDLTYNVNTEDCPHKVFNGEGYGCRIYEDQSCDNTDFIGCHFRQNKRLLKKLEDIKNEIQYMCGHAKWGVASNNEDFNAVDILGERILKIIEGTNENK